MTKPIANGPPTDPRSQPDAAPSRAWAASPSHTAARRATALLIGVWIVASISAPWLAQPVSDVAFRLWDLTGQSAVPASALEASERGERADARDEEER